MAGSGAQIIIKGIPSYDPLYVPLAAISDMQGGYTVPQAGKLGNSADNDISTNLATFPLITDLSAGWGARFFDPQAHAYYLPSVAGTGDGFTTGPLPWTLLPTAPLLPGCGWTTMSGAYAITNIDFYKNALWALDAKNKKALKLVAGAWTDQTAGLTKTPTDLFIRTDTQSDFLLVGQGAAGDGSFARRWDGAAWTNFQIGGVNTNAQHFELVNENLWYTTGNALREIVTAKGVEARAQRVGFANQPINKIVWFGQDIIVGKPEGIFVYSPNTRTVSLIQPSPTIDPLCGRFLTVHNGMCFFNVGESLYAWDGNAVRDQSFIVYEGNGAKPFYGGQCVDGWSDGRRLYLIFKVATNDVSPTYDYFLIIYTGSTGGFHPIFHLASTTNPSVEPGGMYLLSNKLYYSMSGNADGTAPAGYLDTNGEVPMLSGASAFAKGAIVLGLWDAQRPINQKWLKELHLKLVDRGTNKGKLKAYFKRPTDANWILIGETAAGTNDQIVMAMPTDTGAQAGVTGYAFWFKFELTNVDASPANVWYLDEAYVVGRIHYSPAFSTTFAVPLATDEAGGIVGTVRSSYDSARVLAGLKAGIDCAAALTLVHPDKGQFVGHLLPVQGGDIYVSAEADTGKPKMRQFRCAFLEAK